MVRDIVSGTVGRDIWALSISNSLMIKERAVRAFKYLFNIPNIWD